MKTLFIVTATKEPFSNLRLHGALLRLTSDHIRHVALCEGKWSLREAEMEAVALMGTYSSATYLMLGTRVCRAFGCSSWARFIPRRIESGALWLPLPPSSRIDAQWQRTRAACARVGRK